MWKFEAFRRNRSGSMLPRFAVICGGISIVCMSGAWSLDQMTRSGSLARLSSSFSPTRDALAVPASGRTTLSQTTVDYTPTGSIPNNLAQPVVLDPCTGARKR
jgi:hypothetical protein